MLALLSREASTSTKGIAGSFFVSVIVKTHLKVAKSSGRKFTNN
jgi:hypothetical protein